MTMRSNKPVLLMMAAAAALPLSATVSYAQAGTSTGSIHGHVQDPIQQPIAGGQVEVTTDGKNVKYTFTTDANGDYKGSGIAPGTYVLVLMDKGKSVDDKPNVAVAAGQDETEDFDLSRAEYIAKMSPEERKAMQEVQQKNAAAVKDNVVIKGLNADLAKARDDIKNKNFADADALMTKDTQAKPDASILWLELGEAQNGEKKYADAETSLKKAQSLETASAKPAPGVLGGIDNALGEAEGSNNDVPGATASYDAAAKADPTSAGMYYTNETIVLSRTGNSDATAAAADKAIAAAPDNPIPYYLKGQALISKATVDPKTQKIVAPPGCAEAYQKYLELAPDGPFAADAKNILASMGETVKTSYHAGKH